MTARLRRTIGLSFAVAALATTLVAQGQRRLSIDAIYDPSTRVSFSGTPPQAITWIDEGTYLLAKRTGGRTTWVRVDAASGRESSLFDA